MEGDFSPRRSQREELARILDAIAACAQRGGPVDQALAYVEEGMRVGAGRPGYHLDLANCLMRLLPQTGYDRRVADGVLRTCRRAIELGVNGAFYSNGRPVRPWDPYAIMARAYLQTKEFVQARHMFHRAKVAGQPYDIDEGEWFSAQGRNEEAVRFYQTLFERCAQHDHQTALLCKERAAIILRRMGQLNEAISTFHEAISYLRSTDGLKDEGPFWYQIAMTYAQFDQYEPFIEALRQAIDQGEVYREWAKRQGLFAKYNQRPDFVQLVTGA